MGIFQIVGRIEHLDLSLLPDDTIKESFACEGSIDDVGKFVGHFDREEPILLLAWLGVLFADTLENLQTLDLRLVKFVGGIGRLECH